MIPKIIHYAWFGDKKKPKNVQNCINTWKKRLPDFRIIEWNETNAPLSDNKFVKQAYENKMWAFVSDYVRIAVVNKYGGVYLDTDVNVLKDFTPLLNNQFFTGFESEGMPFTAVFGAVKHHPLTEKILGFYRQSHFDTENIRAYINTTIVSRLLIDDYGCDPHDSDQLLINGIRIYPSSVLCNPGAQSYAIHIRNGSWVDRANISTKIGVFLRGHLKNQRQIYLYLMLKHLEVQIKSLRP